MKTSTILAVAAVAFVLWKAGQAKAQPTGSSTAQTTNTGGTAGSPISGGPWWMYAGQWGR